MSAPAGLPTPEYIADLVVRLRNTVLVDDISRLDAAYLIERLYAVAYEAKEPGGYRTAPSTTRCTCAVIVNLSIPHARTCPMSSTNREGMA